MQDYDVALKLLLQRASRATIRELTGTAIDRWLDVELPKVQNQRADLLGQTVVGDIVHLELQSSNDALMRCEWPNTASGFCVVTGEFRAR
jgi:hypothetical protein